MGLKKRIRKTIKKKNRKEKEILRKEGKMDKYLKLKIKVEQIVDKVNDLDWLDMQEVSNEKEIEDIMMRF